MFVWFKFTGQLQSTTDLTLTKYVINDVDPDIGIPMTLILSHYLSA
jgi:hypothetical protein